MNIHFSNIESVTRFNLPILARKMTESGPCPSSAVTHAGLMHSARTTTASANIWKGGEIMKIDLTSREVPSPGQQPGVFTQVYQTVQTHKRDRKFNYLVLVGELKATKSSGRRFTATTRFNLDDLRGIKNLRENLQTWRGSSELPSLTDFDPEVEFVGKTFVAEPTVFDDEGKREIRFSGFKPYTGDSPLTADAETTSVNAAS